MLHIDHMGGISIWRVSRKMKMARALYANFLDPIVHVIQWGFSFGGPRSLRLLPFNSRAPPFKYFQFAGSLPQKHFCQSHKEKAALESGDATEIDTERISEMGENLPSMKPIAHRLSLLTASYIAHQERRIPPACQLHLSQAEAIFSAAASASSPLSLRSGANVPCDSDGDGIRGADVRDW